jgi:hypothetical protein
MMGKRNTKRKAAIMTTFLTKHEYTELLGLTASAIEDRAALTTHDRARLVTLTEKASESDMDDINEALDDND